MARKKIKSLCRQSSHQRDTCTIITNSDSPCLLKKENGDARDSCNCKQTFTWLQSSNDDHRKGYKDLLTVDELDSGNSWWVRKFAHLVSSNRRKSFFYEDVSTKVLSSKRVNDAISTTISLHLDECGNNANYLATTLAKTRQHASAILSHMKSRVSSVLVKITGWLLYKILGSVFMSMQVKYDELKLLKHTCSQDLPVIFLPSHRSHLDYILLTYICYNMDCKLPQIAAGNNLDIPIVRNIIRRWGAFFIRRKIDHADGTRDHLYRAVLHQYLLELLKSGQEIEFFLEGGRTRTGRSLKPKGGLLSVVVDAFFDGVIPDAYIIPISFSYEKVPEGSFATELMGFSKKDESLYSVIVNLVQFFTGSFGHVYVHFSQPYSLKQYLKAADSFTTDTNKVVQLPSSKLKLQSPRLLISALSATALGPLEQRHLVQTLADHVIYDTSHSQILMPTHILAFLLLYRLNPDGATMEEFDMSIEWLIKEAKIRNRITGISIMKDGRENIVKHATQLFGNKLWKEKDNQGKLKISYNKEIEAVLELNYYANSIVSVFALESLLTLSINACINSSDWTTESTDKSIYLHHSDIMNKAEDLYVILEKEFMWIKPCSRLSLQLTRSVQLLESKEIIISLDENSNAYSQQHLRKEREEKYTCDYVSWETEDESEEMNRDPLYKVNISNKKAMAEFKFLQALLEPILETYIATVENVHLLKENSVPERTFVTKICTILIEQVQNAESSTPVQTISSESVINATKCLEKLQILTSSIEHGKKYLSINSIETISLLKHILRQYHSRIL